LPVVLDNASYQRAYAVCTLAKQLDIQLLFLPPYSPNLNLIERYSKFLRKKVTRNLFHPPLPTSAPLSNVSWTMSPPLLTDS
jgi:transposase